MTAADDPRLEVRVFRLADLLRDIAAGQILAPRVRVSMWSRDEVAALFDSLVRGHPIGAMLLWQRPDARLLVDGLQRVDKLRRLLVDDDPDEDPLHYDLEQGAVVDSTFPDEPSARHLPLPAVLDEPRLRTWLQTRGRGADEAAVLRLCQRVRDAPIAVHVLHTADEAAVRLAYDRLLVAHPMRPRAVFSALANVAPDRPAPRPRDLPELAQSLRCDHEFGYVGVDLLARMLAAIRGRRVPRPTRDDLSALAQAADLAIPFIKKDAGIPHLELVPAEPPLLALAALFARSPRLPAPARERLALWLWRDALARAHGVPAPTLADLLAVVRHDDEHAVADTLLAAAPRAPATLPTRPFAANPAQKRLLQLALHDLAPRHLTLDRPQPWTPSLLRHILPRRTDEWRRDLANQILHAATARSIRKTLISPKDPALLAAHAVSPDAHLALRRGDEPRFLELRAATLRPIVDAFLARRARWAPTA